MSDQPGFSPALGGLAQRLAERYRAHPALWLWHVSNEYGPSCYCERCAARFRNWLQTRYGSLEEVNRRWQTAFWSHTYTDWEQISPPGPRRETSIQGLTLDYRRFMSEMNLECYRGEADVLHAVTPDVPVTTNFMRYYKPLDYFAWAPYLDVISWDSYPQREDHPSSTALMHDLMRGLKGGQSWLLMEQTPSQVQWRPHNPLKRPGVLRLWSYQAVAHGSDAVMYFQWRQSRGAAEKYHGAIVSHAGHEHTRVFNEVAELGAELGRLGNGILGTRVPARVALVFSWPNWWNVEYRPGPSSALNYVEEVQRYYQALWERNIAVDVVSPDSDLTSYALVIAPLLNMVSAEQGAALTRYVEQGGTFLTTFFSGVVDENDRAWLGGYPGPLRRMLGIWVEEFDPLEPDMRNRVLVPGGSWLPSGSYDCDLWCDLVHLEGAQALATYEEDFYAGRPAITEHRYGQGRALYVATRPAQPLIAAVIERLLDDVRRGRAAGSPGRRGSYAPRGRRTKLPLCPEPQHDSRACNAARAHAEPRERGNLREHRSVAPAGSGRLDAGIDHNLEHNGVRSMEYTHLGRTGLQVSRLCLGTMNFGAQADEAASFAIMDGALEQGINFFDTANVYGTKRAKVIRSRSSGAGSRRAPRRPQRDRSRDQSL